MKKILLLFCLYCVVALQAQVKSYDDSEAITFFGVDYTLTRLYGAGEEPYQYKMIFRELNSLFKSDPKKYNLNKLLGKKDVKIQPEQTNERNNKIESNNLKILNKEYKVSDQQIKELISSIDTGDAEGYGVIMVCTLLERNKNRGHYNVVIFDIATRDIIRNKSVNGKAASTVSFQDYWGTSLVNALKAANK